MWHHHPAELPQAPLLLAEPELLLLFRFARLYLASSTWRNAFLGVGMAGGRYEGIVVDGVVAICLKACMHTYLYIYTCMDVCYVMLCNVMQCNVM